MKRYKHNLGYYNLASFDMGQLVPVGLTEALPGDTIQHSANAIVRVSPMAAPVMHNATVRIHHFFVPLRLVWDKFEDFITGGPDGNNADTIPQLSITAASYDFVQLADYLGVPRPDITVPTNVSALPFRCYNLIFNEFYRDQDLQSPLDIESAAYSVQNCAWEKDYFTTARPWTQKGPDVTLPVGGITPVKSTVGGPRTYTGASFDATGDAYFGTTQGVEDRLWADNTQTIGPNVNEFRKAFAIQRYQEARARYGSRYTEYLRYLGVRPRDERLQRPEYLGGGHSQVQFSEVLQTGPETGTEPSTEFGVGDLYGHGVAAMRSNAYRRTIEEHGYIMTLMSVRPKAIYAQSLDRTFLRKDKEDFFQKELQHIGQQEIKKAEVYSPIDADPEGTWGYQDRYAEYRQNFSKVTGEFRDVLDYWHMARKFDAAPALNEDFIKCEPTKRIYNVQARDVLWCNIQHKMAARRLVDRSAMPKIY